MASDEFLVDDDAVTPVIGIILLIAIAVVLAATVAALAFTLSDRKTNPAPSVSFTYEFDRAESNLTITHDGGSKFDNVTVTVQFFNGTSVPVAAGWPTTVQAGDKEIHSGVVSDDEIRIVWEDPRDQGHTEVIGSWSGPDA